MDIIIIIIIIRMVIRYQNLGRSCQKIRLFKVRSLALRRVLADGLY